MARLDKERQERLEPQRMADARESIEAMGYEIFFSDAHVLAFMFNDSVVQYYPYSGWHSGKTIKDGRGLRNLLKQIKKPINI